MIPTRDLERIARQFSSDLYLMAAREMDREDAGWIAELAQAELDRRRGAEDISRAHLRCARTGNPCGTDTVPVGYDCPCGPCIQWKHAWRAGYDAGRREAGKEVAFK